MESSFDVRDIYTPIHIAKEEVWRRWNDEGLRKKVEEFLGGDLPEFAKEKPKGYLVRDVISPNKEFEHYMDLVEATGLEPCCLEYADGKLVARNLNKYHLCRMFFHNGCGKNGGDKICTKTVVDFNEYEGKKLKDVMTTSGERLVDFHHRILAESYPAFDIASIHDFSRWFNKHRNKTEYYYLYYLALFVAHGVLFDNFILNKGEKEFTEKKIIPSFRKLEEIFGIKPLVVPLTPIEDENELYWWSYSGINLSIL